MRIELFAFDGCPNVRPTIALLKEAMRLEAVDAAIHIIDVDGSESAEHLRFLGSPSVRIDGEDVELAAMERTAFGMMCRTYDPDNGGAGTPSVDMIRTALRRAALTRRGSRPTNESLDEGAAGRR